MKLLQAVKVVLFAPVALVASMAADPLERFGPYISHNEGFHLSPYKDTTGHYTVGVGHKLRVHEAIRVYTAKEVSELFRADLLVAVHDARKLFPEFDRLPLPAQLVIVDLSFQLGYPGFFKFHHFRRSVRQGDWKEAARELYYSDYYEQCEGRASRNIRQLESLVP